MALKNTGLQYALNSDEAKIHNPHPLKSLLFLDVCVKRFDFSDNSEYSLMTPSGIVYVWVKKSINTVK